MITVIQVLIYFLLHNFFKLFSIPIIAMIVIRSLRASHKSWVIIRDFKDSSFLKFLVMLLFAFWKLERALYGGPPQTFIYTSTSLFLISGMLFIFVCSLWDDYLIFKNRREIGHLWIIPYLFDIFIFLIIFNLLFNLLKIEN